MNFQKVNQASVSMDLPNRKSFLLGNLSMLIATALLSLSGVAASNNNVKVATSRSVQDCTNCPTLEMVQLPRGKFMMGGDKYSGQYRDETPTHQVIVDYDFEIGKYEVTQAQWQAVMGSNPSYFKNCGPNCPVDNVSWNDIQIFIQKLNKITSKQYRLPTEAEWEYACRADTGNLYKYCGGNNIDEVAWYARNTKTTTHPVGQRKPNAWGLHDMSGNVSEWVQDAYHKNYLGAPSNASQAWEDGGVVNETGNLEKVRRGGSWFIYEKNARASIRASYNASEGSWIFGFRLARSLP